MPFSIETAHRWHYSELCQKQPLTVNINALTQNTTCYMSFFQLRSIIYLQIFVADLFLQLPDNITQNTRVKEKYRIICYSFSTLLGVDHPVMNSFGVML